MMVTAKEFISEVYIPLNEGWGYILSMAHGEASGRKPSKTPLPVK